MWRYTLMIGSFQRFKEEGDFTYWIKIPKCKGLKTLELETCKDVQPYQTFLWAERKNIFGMKNTFFINLKNLKNDVPLYRFPA